MAIEQNVVNELVGALKTDTKKRNTIHQAEVTRIDNEGRVWVSVAGSDQETPTEAAASEVSRGDAVNVEWRNNKLYIAGNYSNPAAGVVRVQNVEIASQIARDAASSAMADAGIARSAAESAVADAETAKTSADEAKADAELAGIRASQADAAAEAARQLANTKKTVFITTPTPPYHVGDLWAKLGEDLQDLVDDSDNNLITDQSILIQAAILTDAAVYVCVTPKLEGQAFSDDDWSLATADTSLREWFWHDALGAHILGDVTGFRNDLDSTGMHIIDTNTETSVAEFTPDEAQVGADDAAHISITTDGFEGTGSDGASYFGFKATGASVVNEIRKTIAGRSVAPVRFQTSRTALFKREVDISAIPTNTTCTVSLGRISIRFSNATHVNSQSATNCHIEPSTSSLIYLIRNSTTITTGTSISRTASIRENVSYSGTSQYVFFDISIVYNASTNKVTVTLSAQASSNALSASNIIMGDGSIKYTETVNAPLMTFGTRAEDGGGALSSSLGQSLYASGEYQTAIGKFNEQDSNDEFALIVGNGSDDSNRSNALTVDWSGNVEAAGDITSNNLTSESYTPEWVSSASATRSTVARWGNIVTVHIVDVNKLQTGHNYAFTLPSGWRPFQTVAAMLVSPVASISSGSTALSLRMTISTDGTVDIYNYRSSAITASTNASVTVSFVCDR